MKGLKNIAYAMYDWLMNHHEFIKGEETYQYLSTKAGQDGMFYALAVVFIVSLLTACVFYYAISSNASSATKKNYVVTSLLGFVTVVVLNYLITYLACKWGTCLLSLNMLKINLIDILYYFVLFEIWSLLIKGKSNARTIDYISIFSKK